LATGCGWYLNLIAFRPPVNHSCPIRDLLKLAYKNILLTLDGSLLAEQALHHVIMLAAPKAVIHVLSIVTHEPASLLTEVARSGAYFSPVINSDVLDSLNDVDTKGNSQRVHDRHIYLEQVTRNLVEAGYTVTLDVRTGEAANAIIDTAHDGYEVIVMATHGRTGFSKALLGSVAETVLRQAHCPVLLIPVRATVLAN